MPFSLIIRRGLVLQVWKGKGDRWDCNIYCGRSVPRVTVWYHHLTHTITAVIIHITISTTPITGFISPPLSSPIPSPPPILHYHHHHRLLHHHYQHRHHHHHHHQHLPKPPSLWESKGEKQIFPSSPQPPPPPHQLPSILLLNTHVRTSVTSLPRTRLGVPQHCHTRNTPQPAHLYNI